jgi:serine/threonine-protein kinase
MFGLVLGYLVTVLFVFPPHNVAADLKRVPDVVGRTVDEARRRSEREDLAFEEALAIHHAQPLGTVVAQEPLAGQMAPPRSTLRVTISLGPPERPVPDVVGLSREQAELILLQAGFEVEVTRVDASVSAGASTVLVPDLAMQSLTEAEATLRRLGLRLGEVLEDSAGLAAPGTILGQSPAAGEGAARGARVAVTVAIAPLPGVDSTSLPTDTSDVEPDTAGTRADTTITSGSSG